MDIRPAYANLLKDGEIIEADPDEVSIDEVIVIKPGEKFHLTELSLTVQQASTRLR